jgi:hypothetical protein
MIDDHSFSESVAAGIYSALAKIKNPKIRAKALLRGLGQLDDEQKARVLARLIMSDGAIAKLIDPRGAIPVTFGAWLDVFNFGKRREREQRELVVAIANELETRRLPNPMSADARREEAPVTVGDGKVASSDAKLMKDLVGKQGGDLRSAIKEFVTVVSQRDNIKPKSARARCRQALAVTDD